MFINFIKETFIHQKARTTEMSSNTEVQIFHSKQGYYLPKEEDIKLDQEILDLLKSYTDIEGGLKQREIKKILNSVKNISLDEFVDISRDLVDAIYTSKNISDKQKHKFLSSIVSEIRQRAVNIGVDSKEIGSIDKIYDDNNKLQKQRNYTDVLIKYIEAIISKSKEANEQIRNQNVDKNISNINEINKRVRASLDLAESYYASAPKEKYDFSEKLIRDAFIDSRENISEEEYIERMKGNGKVDQKFWQILKDNCWALGSMKAMLTSEIGTEMLNSHIKKVDGGFLIHLGMAAKKNLPANGVPGVYFISEKEVFEEGALQSVGDGDATALLLAIRQYKTETGDYSEEDISNQRQENLEKLDKHKDIIEIIDTKSKEEIIADLDLIITDLDKISEGLNKKSVKHIAISNLQSVIQEYLNNMDPTADKEISQLELAKIKEDINYWLEKIRSLIDTDVMDGENMVDFYEILTGLDAEPEKYTTLEQKMHAPSIVEIAFSSKLYRHSTPKANEDLPIGIAVRSFDNLSEPDSVYKKYQNLHNEGRIAMSFEISSGLHNNSDKLEIYADTNCSEYTGIKPLISENHAYTVVKIENDYIWIQEPNTQNAYIRCPKETFLNMGIYSTIFRYY